LTPGLTTLVSTDRILGRRSCPDAGPTLVVVGGIHGNESAGVLALQRVVARLETERRLERGDFVALTGNLSALRAHRRFIDEDLNRHFGLDTSPLLVDTVERGEQREILAALEEAFSRARGPVYLLDLHTTSGTGAPFAIFADTMASRRFARRFPLPVVLGFEEQLVGTLIDYVGAGRHVAVGFEGGQHDDPRAVDTLEAIVWLALGELSLVSGSWLREERRELARSSAGAPRCLEVVYRHAITPHDGFHMRPGFRSFELVARGQVVADDTGGPVAAPEEGYLLMPLYQKQGDDGFFLVRRVRTFWLWLSAILRYARLGRFVHWLPGVWFVTGQRHVVRVDRSIARWYSLEILHLLGFRRRAEEGDMLLMERRANDLP